MITIAHVNFWKDPNWKQISSKFIEENIGPVQEVHYKNNPDILIASCCGNIGALDEIKSKCVQYVTRNFLIRKSQNLKQNEKIGNPPPAAPYDTSREAVPVESKNDERFE